MIYAAIGAVVVIIVVFLVVRAGKGGSTGASSGGGDVGELASTFVEYAQGGKGTPDELMEAISSSSASFSSKLATEVRRRTVDDLENGAGTDSERAVRALQVAKSSFLGAATIGAGGLSGMDFGNMDKLARQMELSKARAEPWSRLGEEIKNMIQNMGLESTLEQLSIAAEQARSAVDEAIGMDPTSSAENDEPSSKSTTSTTGIGSAKNSLSEEARTLVDRGLKLIEGSVRYTTWGLESNSVEPVEAAKIFSEAAALQPDNPLPSYLAISAYSIGMQGQTAREKLEEHLSKFPDDLRGLVMKDSWDGVFKYPPYTLGERPPEAIDDQVKQSLIVMTQMDGEPQPVLFSRQDPTQFAAPLSSTTPVVIHPLLVKTPHGPIMAAVAAIGDSLSDPLKAESLVQPFDGNEDEPRLSDRVRFLLHCDRVPVVVLSPSSQVLLAKDAPVGRRCLDGRREMERWYLETKPRNMPQSELISAIGHYQNEIPIERFGLE